MAYQFYCSLPTLWIMRCGRMKCELWNESKFVKGTVKTVEPAQAQVKGGCRSMPCGAVEVLKEPLCGRARFGFKAGRAGDVKTDFGDRLQAVRAL